MDILRRPLLTLVLLVAAPLVHAQPAALSATERQKRIDTEKELQSLAIVERKLMMPMRDGVRLATDVYRPKNASGPVPIVFVRTPYNFNFWDVRNGVPADMTARARGPIKRGYAKVVQNERGHFFSEGHYDILGAPVSDGDDMLEWLKKQPWSNGKVGTTGCSSTAEYQMAIAAQGHPAYAAMNVQGFGAGVGRVAPYFEQGNWYRGGAMQMLFISWLYGEQNQVRPMFPKDTSQEDLIRASKAFDLAQQLPPGRVGEGALAPAGAGHPEGGRRPHGIFADAMPGTTGGRMIQRAPNDPAWYKGGLWHDDMKLDVPGALVHVLVRRLGRAQPRDVQPRAQEREAARRRAAVGGDRAGRALRVHARHRGHGRRRAQHGRRAARLRRDRLRLLRQVPEGRQADAPRQAAASHLLHDGDQQVAELGHAGRLQARRARPSTCRAADGRTRCRRRRPRARGAADADRADTSATTR